MDCYGSRLQTWWEVIVEGSCFLYTKKYGVVGHVLVGSFMLRFLGPVPSIVVRLMRLSTPSS